MGLGVCGGPAVAATALGARSVGAADLPAARRAAAQSLLVGAGVVAAYKGFRELKGLDRDAVRRQRRDKFLAIGRGLS